MKLRIIIIGILATVICNINIAQILKSENYLPQPIHEEWFKAIPMINSSTPEWAVLMYNDDTNFEKILELRRNYLKTNPFKKSIHTQNYKHWYKIVKDYVNDDGKISIPDQATEFRRYEKNKSNSRMTDPWINIGPTETYNSNGSETTRTTQANVYAIEVSPSNTSILYAGMETGGIFKTIDKGLNWFPVSYDYSIGSIQDIKVHPTNSDIVYVGSSNNIYKTTDGGTSWSLIYTASGAIEQFYINTVNGDIIYAATRSNLIKSINAGSTWTTKYTGRCYDIEAKPGSNDILYIATLNGASTRPEIQKSTNAGDSWTLMDNGYYIPSDIPNANVYGCKIGVTPADPNRIYAGIIANGKVGDQGWIGVYYSLDEGVTWQEDSGFDGSPYVSGTDSNTNWYVAGYSDGYHQGFYNFDLEVSHINPDKLWVGTIWYSESGNKGANFEHLRNTRGLGIHSDVQDMEVVGNEIWISTDGGINYSNDECQSVEIRMNGVTASDFWGFGVGWNEDIWVGGRYHNGNAVYHNSYGIGKTVFLGGAETATGYVNQFANKKLHMSDIGDKEISDSLTGIINGIPNLGLYPTQSYYDFSYSEVEWDPRYSNRIYIGNGNILYKSLDGGINFEPLYSFPGDIKRFEISRDDPNYIYAIVIHSSSDHRIHRSTDGGLNFSPLIKPTITNGSWRNLSFTLNPFDKDEIWQASNSSSNDNKIFSSSDGGITWTNKYASELQNQALKDVFYHASPQGDIVYILTNDNFFYYDITQDSWNSYNLGLPVKHSGFKMLPFYRDQKIKLVSAKGIWEVPFINNNRVQALPMVIADTSFCSRDTVSFESYSIIKQPGAIFDWSFSPTPIWISDTLARNPRVLFGDSSNYDVTLTVTDTNGETDTRTIENMVQISNQCAPDTIPGNVLKTIANGDGVVISDANLTNITHFTVTGWWKPNGAQQAYSSLFSSGDWCAHCDYTEGLIVDYWGSKLWYKWPGNADNWGSNSGMTIPLDEWSYVALVIEPDKATMYLNEQKYVHNKALSPGNIPTLHIAYGHYSKSFKGEIDEVTIWNKALNEADIRRMRHLTKQDEIENDPDLIAYYQFNKLVNGSKIMDKAGKFHGNINNGATLTTSNAPIGKGISETISVINGGNYTSATTGVDFEFPNSGTFPNGEIVITRLNLNPNTSPNNRPVNMSYWVINNYGPNASFTALSSITFNEIDNLIPVENATNFQLYQRDANSHQDWKYKSKGSISNAGTATIGFSNSPNITTFGQYSLTNKKAIGWIGVVSTDWNNTQNWSPPILPDADSYVIIPPNTPFQPTVNINTIIRSLTLLQDAQIMVENGIDFQVKE